MPRSRRSAGSWAIRSCALGLRRIWFSVTCLKPTFCATTPINNQLATASTSHGTNQLALRFKSANVLEGAMKTLTSRSPSESAVAVSGAEPGIGLEPDVAGELIGISPSWNSNPEYRLLNTECGRGIIPSAFARGPLRLPPLPGPSWKAACAFPAASHAVRLRYYELHLLQRRPGLRFSFRAQSRRAAARPGRRPEQPSPEDTACEKPQNTRDARGTSGATRSREQVP